MSILFIDCYDSFTYNLVGLIKSSIPNACVSVVHNDKISLPELTELSAQVDAIIVGPGPGHPENDADAGIIPHVWKLHTDVPVLGVCFGLQSLVHAFGGFIRRMELPQHGQFGYIMHSDDQLFNKIPQNNKVVRYHSLHAVVPDDAPIDVIATCATDNLVMAVKHQEKPFYAVQYHPESILSDHGKLLIENFWNLAQKFNKNRTIRPGKEIQQIGISLEPLLKEKPSAMGPRIEKLSEKHDPMRVCQYFFEQKRKFVSLHSCAWPGNWTIIGLIDQNTVHIQCQGDTTKIGPKGNQETIKGDSWAAITSFMQPKLVKIANERSLPFVGGIIGYITYERACNETNSQSNSDMSFVYIENALVVASDGTTYTVGNVPELYEGDITLAPIPAYKATKPNKEGYIQKIQNCKELLKSGDSYELCLTAQTQVELDEPMDPWELFKHITKKNPAPYCTYMDFDDILVGSSPERFLCWDESGKCQFRPIKGTVKKGPNIDYEVAKSLLYTKKELGENLMIVDLIRHDLGQLLPKVDCPETMKIEEYKTVYQLVSVIEGSVKQTDFTGIDVLRHSLPPGSMTGAPKKRSVEILQHLESSARGLYSGVSGYWSIDDVGDWSVVIRSAFQYHGEDLKWRMGAGGAITVLSDDYAEFEEMNTKLESFFQVFH